MGTSQPPYFDSVPYNSFYIHPINISLRTISPQTYFETIELQFFSDVFYLMTFDCNTFAMYYELFFMLDSPSSSQA
jgi:hypothetical protein